MSLDRNGSSPNSATERRLAPVACSDRMALAIGGAKQIRENFADGGAVENRKRQHPGCGANSNHHHAQDPQGQVRKRPHARKRGVDRSDCPEVRAPTQIPAIIPSNDRDKYSARGHRDGLLERCESRFQIIERQVRRKELPSRVKATRVSNAFSQCWENTPAHPSGPRPFARERSRRRAFR